MQAGDILMRARELIQDDKTTYRVANSILLRFLNDGLRDLWRRRPDLRFKAADASVLDVDDLEQTISGETVPGVDLLFADDWREALAHWVAHAALAMDETDVGNLSRSASHFNTYLERVNR